MQRRTAVHLTLLAAALLLAACGGASTAPKATQGALDSKLVNKAPGGDKPLANLRWPVMESGSNLDPTQGGDDLDAVRTNLCDSLTRFNADGTTRPGLATLAGTADPKTFVYDVRPGVRFWNGQALTAEDVAFSLNRNLDPNVASHFSLYYGNVDSIKATGPLQVTIRMKRPDYLFPTELATFAGSIVQKSYAQKEGKNFGTSSGGLMCTGPYRLKSWTSQAIVLSASSGYWDRTLRPKTATLTFPVLADEGTETSALLAGDLDGATVYGSAAATRLQSTRSGTLYYGNSTYTIDLIVTKRPGPLKDPRVREALSIALPRAGIAKTVYAGAAAPAKSIVSAIQPWAYAPPVFQTYFGARPALSTSGDVQRARQMIKQAGLAGSKVNIAVTSEHKDVSDVIVETANAIGLHATTTVLTPTQGTSLYYMEKLRDRFDAFVLPWNSNVPDPTENLVYFEPGGVYNYSGYDNPKYTALVEQALGTADPEQRARLVLQALTILDRDLPWIPIVDLPVLTYLRTGVGGIPLSLPGIVWTPWGAYAGGS